MCRRLAAARRDQRGAIAILAGLSSTIVFVFAATVVDFAHVRDVRAQAQAASDASALAAGNALYASGQTPDINAAVSAAKQYAAANNQVTESEWAACTDSSHLVVPAGGSQCISFSPSLTRPTTVRVVVPQRSVGTPFAGLFGVHALGVGSRAQASLDPGGAARCGLCVVGGDVTHDLQNGDVTVHGGDIAFNGNVNVGANGLVATDGSITVQGSASGPLANYQPNPSVHQPALVDPLLGLTLPPSLAGLTDKSGSTPCGLGAAHGPGVYGAQNLRNLVCALQPGLYVIAGASGTVWDLAGNASTLLSGAGVTLYFTCGTPAAPRACAVGEAGASLDSSGSGLLSLQAPTAGSFQGLALVYDRQNTSLLRLTGNGASNMTGTIYAASGTLEMNGNGCTATYSSLIVVGKIALNGNSACLQSTYNQSANVLLPPGALHLSY